MHIEFRSDELTEADALSLAVLIHQQHPGVFTLLSLMTGTAHRALGGGDETDPNVPPAAQVFAGEGAPVGVARSAEEAFSPQPSGADASAGIGGDGNGGATSGPVDPAGAGVGPSATNASRSDVTLDADGLPWDPRINSSGQATNKDGRWKKKQGVGADAVALVQAELRAALAAGAPPLSPPAPTAGAPTDSTVTPTPAPATAPVAAPPPPAPPAPAAPVPPPPPAAAPTTTTTPPDASGATTVLAPDAIAAAQAAALANPTFSEGQSPAAVFTSVMRFITDGKYTPEEIAAGCAGVGIETPRAIIQKPHLAPEFLATLSELRAG